MMRWLMFLLFWTVPAYAVVDIQEVTSPGGIKAWLVEDRSIPFTALEIKFKGGAALDPADKAGATFLMTGLLEEGAGTRDAQAFAEARESLAASFSFSSYRGATEISARFLTENREKAVDLLRDALVNPTFEQDAIERVRAQVLSIIRSNEKDPQEIVQRRFAELAYGDHPFAMPNEGSLDTVTALSRDDIIAAHRAGLVRDRIFVAAAGDIGAEELGLLLDKLLGDLPLSNTPLPTEVTSVLPNRIEVVNFDTPQSVIRFGHSGIARDDPDFFAAFLVNQVFGGSGMTSTLMEEVREKRGLTYGISSFLTTSDYVDLVMGQAQTDNRRVLETIEVVRDLWSDLAQNGISAEELAAAKTYLIGSYPLRFDGNAQIAGIMASMQMIGLGPDYITSRNAKIESVTVEQAREVAARLFQPEALGFIVVGQPEGLSDQNQPPLPGTDERTD